MRVFAVMAAVWAFTLHCVGSNALYDPPGGKGFWARRSDLSSGDSSFYRVTAMFAASSKNAEIYTEAKNEVSKTSIDGLLNAFENSIVPVEHLWFTTPTDVDNNGKIILLLLDIQDGYKVGGGYIAGYFDPINHYSETSVSAVNSKYHSNHAEMLYLDTYPADVTKTSFFATLAHEYQHLLQFGKYYKGEQADTEPSWVDEGLAEVSSDLTGFGPQTGRANNFRSALLNGTSLIKEPGAFLLDNYATSYIYFRYVADVYGLGGISAIFRSNLTGVAGVNAGIQSSDSGLTSGSVCKDTSGFTYPHFSCSYRFMWAALISGTPGDQPTSAKIRFNSPAAAFSLGSGSTYDYALKPATSAYRQELMNTLTSGSYSSSTNSDSGALQSYSPKLVKINGSNTDTNFSTGGAGLTIVAGTSYYVVFNHDVSTTTTHGANIVDNITTGENPPLQVQSAPVEEAVVTAAPLETRKLHWHFPLRADMREFLQPAE